MNIYHISYIITPCVIYTVPHSLSTCYTLKRNKKNHHDLMAMLPTHYNLSLKSYVLIHIKITLQKVF